MYVWSRSYWQKKVCDHASMFQDVLDFTSYLILFFHWFPVYIYIIAFNCTHIIYTYLYIYICIMYIYIELYIYKYIYTCVFFPTKPIHWQPTHHPHLPGPSWKPLLCVDQEGSQKPTLSLDLSSWQAEGLQALHGLHDLHGRQDTSFLFRSYLHVFTYKLQTTNWSNLNFRSHY